MVIVMDNSNQGFGQDNLFGNESDEFDNLFNDNNSQSDNNNVFQDSSNSYEDQFIDTATDSDSDSGSVKKTALIIAGAGLALLITVVLIAGALSKKSEQGKQEDISSTGNQATYIQKVDPNELMNTTGNNVSNTVSTPEYTAWTELNDNTEIDFKDYIKASFTVTDIKHYVRNSSPDGTYIVKTTLTGMISGYSGTYTLDVPYNKGIILATNPDLGIGCTFDVSILIGEYNGKKFIGDITTNVYE